MHASASQTRCAPESGPASSVTVTSFAMPWPMFVTVAKSLKRSPRAHHGRHGESHVEEGIAHEHAAAGLARDRHRPDGQPVEDGRDVEVEGVEALLLAAEQELRLALLAGGEAVVVVGGAGLAVRARRRGRASSSAAGPRTRLGQARADRRRVPGSWSAPGGRWIVPVTFVTAEARAHRRAVRDEELRREELLQVADVAGDDEHGRDADRLPAGQRDRKLPPPSSAPPSSTVAPRAAAARSSACGSDPGARGRRRRRQRLRARARPGDRRRPGS